MSKFDTDRIITYSFCVPFLPQLAEFIDKNYYQTGRDTRRLAIVFGGRRPALFLRRELARRLGRAFVPPKFFTIDEFVRHAVLKHQQFSLADDLEQSYRLYNLAKEFVPQVVVGRESFARFLPWAREIANFVDQLDLEQVADEQLQNVASAAGIGFPVPEEINRLLAEMIPLRRAYHRQMRETGIYSRGYQYLQAALLAGQTEFAEFDEIIFANFFYFHRTEEALVKSVYARGQARFFFQGDERRWPVIKHLAKRLDCHITEGTEVETPKFALSLHAGFDVHSQAGWVREILKTVPDPERTVIVVPKPDNVIPLLSELSGAVADFNVSMGYPLRRSSLTAFLELIFSAQLSRREEAFYARDYLRLLRHPLLKNLQGVAGAAATRILIHKIEEILTGKIKASLSGCLFIRPQDVEAMPELFDETLATLQKMGTTVQRADLEETLRLIHGQFLTGWATVQDFQSFALRLEAVLNILLNKSSLAAYPLNLKIAVRIQDIVEEIKVLPFREEPFSFKDIARIFSAKMDSEIVSFSGSPLKGLQILGLFETRSLNFDRVIVMDVNEGVLPHVNLYEPLIPREVMLSLGLDRLEQEEQMQRYQFMRLISSAKSVHLVYQESADKERSRFVEELVWDVQKKTGQLTAVPVLRAGFAVEVARQERAVKKTREMISFLRSWRYSASSVNLYLRNPLEFYHRYVLGLVEQDDLLDEPENRQVGTFVHELLEETFQRFVGRAPVIDRDFRRYFNERFEERFAAVFTKVMPADAFLLKKVLEVRLSRFLDNEADSPERRVKEVMFIEKSFDDVIPLSCGDVRFVYKVDRIDRMADGTVMVLDYKTGSVDPMPKGIERIEKLDLSRESVLETVHSFQIPLYFHYLEKYFQQDNVNAAFYNLRTLDVAKFVDHKMSFDRGRINRAFLRALDFIMAEIFDPEVPFVEVKEPR